MCDVIVPSAYKPSYLTKMRLYNCFAKGTLVRTRTGLTPIERLKEGDQALTRDETTGELSFRPIVQVFRKPGKPVLNLDLGRESITTTANHWLWRVGEGWVAASDLKPGDRLRTLDSVAEVVAASKEFPQTVYNLDVSGNHNFLIGQSGVLVHDGGIVDFVRRPFDAVNLEPPRPAPQKLE